MSSSQERVAVEERKQSQSQRPYSLLAPIHVRTSSSERGWLTIWVKFVMFRLLSFVFCFFFLGAIISCLPVEVEFVISIDVRRYDIFASPKPCVLLLLGEKEKLAQNKYILARLN